MNRSGGMKLAIVIIVIVVVVIATFLYGNAQRNKQKSAGSPDNLPTIENSEEAKQSQQSSENKPAEPKPQAQPNQPAPATGGTPQAATPPTSGGTNSGAQPPKPSQPQIPAAQTPATGAVDTVVPAVVLGLLSGGYLITRRQRRLQTESLQRRSNQI